MGHTKNKIASRKYTAKIHGDHMIAVNEAGTTPTAKYHVTLDRKKQKDVLYTLVASIYEYFLTSCSVIIWLEEANGYIR